MPVVHTPERPRVDARMLLFPLAIFSALIVILVRLWYIQVVSAPDLRERASAYGTSTSAVLAPRGLVYDRSGRMIAGIQEELVLTAQPALVLKDHSVLERLAQALRAAGAKSCSFEHLMRKAKDGAYKPYAQTPIYAGAPIQVAAKVTEDPSLFPGIQVQTQPTRYYPDPVSFSHLLGYVWVPGPKDVERAQKEHRELGEFVGKGGLEWVYEGKLEGQDGSETVVLGDKRQPLRMEDREEPAPGQRLTLSLDASLQETAIKALGSYKGAVVALEPSTGEVLCLASTPTFDLTLFRNGISQEDFDVLNDSPGHPFINRAVGTALSPGSTFKIVTTVAAMRAGVFDPSRTVYCDGGYRLGRQFFGCLERHGAITFQAALEQSCNTYFSDLAMRVGKDELRQTALDMGFYSKSGIDLPYERSGLIPTDDWLKRAKKTWVPGFTVLTGIGQGDVLTTPLQMADMAAMVANSGVIYRPHLLKAYSQDGQEEHQVEPQVFRSVDLPMNDWDTIRRAMIGVVQEGTAQGQKIPGLTWGAKTGSAEVRGQDKTNSWFVGFAPADHPRIAICVMVEAVGHGALFAGPIAKKVVESYLFDSKADSKSATALSAQATPVASPSAR